MADFGFSSTATAVAQAFSENIRGKTILVTGVSPKSIGAEFIRSISTRSPKLLILASRNLSTLKLVEDDLKTIAPQTPTRLVVLDLSSQKQIRQAAAEVISFGKKIDVLVNNAGVMGIPYKLTEDGVEMQLGVNHLGHFLLTNLLIGTLSNGARIVNVSSIAHTVQGFAFENYNWSNGTTYDKMGAYCSSKTANILFTISLASKLSERNIKSFSLHPGSIVTGLLKDMDKETMKAYGWINDNGEFVDNAMWTWKTLEQGAATHVVASFDPALDNMSGVYLHDCKVTEAAPHATDAASAEKLWTLSETWVGQKFVY